METPFDSWGVDLWLIDIAPYVFTLKEDMNDQ
jgi:hypothetical protein